MSDNIKLSRLFLQSLTAQAMKKCEILHNGSVKYYTMSQSSKDFYFSQLSFLLFSNFLSDVPFRKFFDSRSIFDLYSLPLTSSLVGTIVLGCWW